MKNSKLKIKYIAVAWALLAGGVLFLGISNMITNVNFGSFINDIGSAILISGILGVIDQYILQDSLVGLILDKLKIKESVNNTGLEELLPGMQEVNYKYYFKDAKKNIDIVHIYGKTWTNNNIDEISDRVVKGNCKVRVVLVDPESLFVPALEEHFRYENGELSKLIKDVSKMWKMKYDKKQEQKKRATQGTIELYYHKGQPTNAMYRIDDRIIVVQTKTSQEKTTRMPAMIFKDTNKEDCIFNIYNREIEQIIRESKQVNFDEV